MSKKYKAIRKKERKFVLKTYSNGNRKHKLGACELESKRIKRNKRRNLLKRLLKAS